MASGNLGDLWFQLGIKDNTHKALNSMLKDVQRLEGMINSLNQKISDVNTDAKDSKKMKAQLSNALNYLHLLQKVNIELNKISGIKNVNAGINTGELDRAKKALMDFRNELINLQSGKTAGGVDKAFMSAYNAKFRNLITDVRQIEKAFDKENTLSASKNNAARLNRELETTKNKLAEIQSLQSRGVRNGIDTTALLSGGNTLRGVKRRMETMLADDNLLANGAKVKSLLSDIAFAYTKATGKVQEYKRTASETASVDSALSKQKLAVEQINTILGNIDKLKGKSLEIGTDTSKLTAVRGEIERIKTTIESFSGKQLLNKGFGDALNELQLWKERVNRTLKDQSGANQSAKATDRNLETMEARYRRLQELISEVNRKIRELNDSARQGIKVGADTSRAESAISRLTEMRDKFNNADIGSKNAVAELVSEYKILKNEIGNAKSEQDKLNNAITRANKKQDRKNERQETRDNKQRLSEIKAAEARYDSLGNKVRALRREFSRGISLGADVSKAEAEIHRLIDIMRYLRQMRTWLVDGQNVVGRIGSIGTGHDTTLAGRVLQDQRRLNSEQERANREAQKGVDLERQRQQEIAKSAAKVRSDLVRAFEQAKNSAGGLNSTMQDLKSLVMQGGLFYGMQQFAMSVITTGGELEKQHIALQSILGDMQNANAMFSQIKQLALQSPFTFSELNRDVKQLAAYGVEYDQLYDTTKRLADMASGLGVSFERIALAFGQVRSRGWLDGKELRQISYAGIPLLQKLSEYYSKREGRNVSTSEIKTRISGRGVDFEDVKNVFWEMTDAGGQFYNMQFVLSETLLGRFNKLKDAWEIMLSEFASDSNIVGSNLKHILDLVTSLVQSLHTMAPVVVAAFSGFALKRLQTSLGGGIGAALLSGKASIASDVQKKVLLGEETTKQELRLLATKKLITSEDIKALSLAKAIKKVDLERMYINGQISRSIYKDGMTDFAGTGTFGSRRKLVEARQNGGWWNKAKAAFIGLQLRTNAYFTNLKIQFATTGGFWRTFALKGMSAFAILTAGARTMGATLLAAVGGLPGLIITGVTMGISYMYTKSADLTNRINQTANEIEDRIKQLNDFLRENDTAKVLAGGDIKEVDNLIDAYKEKLKQLEPYNYNNLVMKADEKQSHEERLKYLDEELKRLRDAEMIAKSKMGNRDNYSDFSGAIIRSSKNYERLEKTTAENMSDKGMDFASARSAAWKDLQPYQRSDMVNPIKKVILKQFGDISKDETMRLAAMQAMSGIFSSMGVPEDKADIIRTSILQAFGCGDKSAWLQSEVSNSMIALIDKSFPMIGEKIRASVPLNDAEKAKVRELMNDAKNGLIRQYPELERTLQNMLAASNFQAVIKLVIDGGDKLNNLQSELVKRIPSKYSGLMMSDISGQYKTYAERWGKENSWYSARNAANEDITKALNEYKSAKKSNAKNVKELYTKWQTVKQAAHDLLNYDFDGEYKKSNKIPKGKKNTHVNQEDKELETLRKRIDLYKKFYSELEKYRKIYGDEGAMIQMRSDKEFKNSVLSWKLSDPGTYGSSVRELMNRLPSSTQKRREYKESQQADIHAKNRSIEEERIRETNNMLSKRLNIISEQHKTYKKIYELTGNSKGASMLAFGYVQSGTYQDYLKEQMKWAVKEHNERTGQSLSADDVLKMNESDFNKHIGSESENASVIYKEWVEETARIKQETIDLLANLVEKNATIDQQIEDENRKYERQLELIKGIKDAGMRDRATEGAEKTHNENLAKLEFEKFKQESDWVTIFDDLDRVSSSTINSMIEKIDGFSKTTGLSVEVVKQLRDALGKLRDEQIDRNPINGIVGGMQRGNAIGSFIGSRFRKGMDISTTTYVDSSDAKKMGIKEGNYTKGQLENEKKGAYEDANKGVSKLADKFKALQDCLTPVISLFEVLGEEDSFLGQATNMASGAFGAAAQVSGGLNALGLGSLGPYGAAAGAALSVVTSLFAMHDKALQKEIEASEERQKELDNMTKNVKSIIEDALGGIYSYKERSDTKSIISKITSNYELADAWKKTGIGKSLPFLVKSVYSKETYEAAKEAQSKPGSAYHAELASLKAQKDELQSQRNSENEKKKKDNSKIADYDQQIKEMELQIDSFAKDFLKDIYSIDFKSWASELTDAVVGAWEKGEDAVEAYKKKAKDMVKDLTKNIISQKIMEVALQGPLDNLTEIIKQKGKLEPEDVVKVADDLYNGTNDAAENITAILERLKDMGLDLSENGDGSVTNGIKNITEETADILASYVNAIRLDVSVNRAQVKDIGELLKMRLPEMGQIQKAQLGQLTQIVMLAEARNEKLDRMMDWMNAVSTSGRKKLYIS